MKWYEDKKREAKLCLISRDALENYLERWQKAQVPFEVTQINGSVTLPKEDFERLLALRTIPLPELMKSILL